MSFADRLDHAVSRFGPGCVGLDPHLHLLPAERRARFEGLTGAAFRATAAAEILAWGLQVLDAVAGQVGVIKPQVAFFEQLGSHGWATLEQLVARAKELGILVLLDAKRGDIGSTARGYALGLLDDAGPIGADALTVSPYLGRDSIQPLLDVCDAQGKGLFVLVRTSNPGGGDLQPQGAAAAVAGWIRDWNATRLGASGFGPVGAVVGATVPAEASALRAAMPNAWILVPGYGAQGGSAADTLPCFRSDGRGALVNSSRGVLFGADPGGAGVRRRAQDLVGDLARALAL